MDFDWCKNCDVGLPKPDICFYLEAMEENLSERGGYGGEKYEKKEYFFFDIFILKWNNQDFEIIIVYSN